MKVEDIMSAAPLTCEVSTNLAEVAHLMWEGDCGIIPITGDGNKVIGLVTDRDICMAAATRNRAPSQMCAGDVRQGDVVSCHVGDRVQTALRLMKEHRIRRLPVVTQDGTLRGVIVDERHHPRGGPGLGRDGRTRGRGAEGSRRPSSPARHSTGGRQE